MNKSAWIICVVLMASCLGVWSGQNDKPAFKGVELYSWNPVEQGWRFSLLQGTNRNKTTAEITASENVIVGVDTLKAKLALLPKGEIVSWRNVAKEPVPAKTVKEIRTFCKEHGITLQEM